MTCRCLSSSYVEQLYILFSSDSSTGLGPDSLGGPAGSALVVSYNEAVCQKEDNTVGPAITMSIASPSRVFPRDEAWDVLTSWELFGS